MPITAELAGLVEAIAPQVTALRRRLHEHPEPSHREVDTTNMVRSVLEAEGIVFHGRGERTGGWADVGNGVPRVGFRADLDALPITEPSDNDPRSGNDGWMHACGHDAHTAIAVGIAMALHRLRPDSGVRIIFQPGEEASPGGAVELVAEGVVDGLQGLLAVHVDPSLRAGKIGGRAGPITASADAVTIVLHGPGGHTSRPHRTVDLIEAAGRVVTELPTVIRKNVDARSPVVTAFGAIEGGNTFNVIPTEVVIRGTVRTFDQSLWDVLPGLVDKALGSILAISGAGYTLDYKQGIPPVVNDDRIVAMARAGIDEALGPGTVVPTQQSMGGEDFSNYLSITPGALFRLGVASGGGDIHSAGFLLNEDAIPVGVHAGTAALLALLDTHDN